MTRRIEEMMESATSSRVTALREPGAPISVAEIQRAVALRFGVSILHMNGTCRARRVARPRQVAMYLARVLTGKSYPAIGREFGLRHHTTVMYAHKAILLLAQYDHDLGERVATLIAELAA